MVMSFQLTKIKAILRKDFNIQENDVLDIQINSSNELIVEVYFKPVCPISSITINNVIERLNHD